MKRIKIKNEFFVCGSQNQSKAYEREEESGKIR